MNSGWPLPRGNAFGYIAAVAAAIGFRGSLAAAALAGRAVGLSLQFCAVGHYDYVFAQRGEQRLGGYLP